MAGIVQRLRLNNCATMMPQRYNVPAPPISLELKEMGGASIVPQRGGRSYRSPLQRSGRGWRSPAAAGRTAGRPIVSYGFVGIAFVSVSRLCPYRYPTTGEILHGNCSRAGQHARSLRCGGVPSNILARVHPWVSFEKSYLPVFPHAMATIIVDFVTS